MGYGFGEVNQIATGSMCHMSAVDNDEFNDFSREIAAIVLKTNKLKLMSGIENGMHCG